MKRRTAKRLELIVEHAWNTADALLQMYFRSDSPLFQKTLRIVIHDRLLRVAPK